MAVWTDAADSGAGHPGKMQGSDVSTAQQAGLKGQKHPDPTGSQAVKNEIVEHALSFEDLAKHLGTDFEAGLTTQQV